MSDDATPSQPDRDDAESLLRPSAEEKRAQETVMLNQQNIEELMAAAREAAGARTPENEEASATPTDATQAGPAPTPAADVGADAKRSSSAIFIFVGVAIVVLIAVLVLVAR